MLVITGIRMRDQRDEEFQGEENAIVRQFLRRFIPMTANYDGKHFFVVQAGVAVATPLLLVLILVEFTDLIFAVDSIPAIFGVTTRSIHRLHVEYLRDPGPAVAVLPARRGRSDRFSTC